NHPVRHTPDRPTGYNANNGPILITVPNHVHIQWINPSNSPPSHDTPTSFHSSLYVARHHAYSALTKTASPTGITGKITIDTYEHPNHSSITRSFTPRKKRKQLSQ
ncbi:Hypothetical predicted protein, partial [Pelobates cultripes]